MGNSQATLSGIHPFKDDSDPPPTKFIPPAPIANLALPELPPPPQSSQLSSVSTQQPQHLALAAGWSSITADPQPEKFDDLFIVKAPTPPPRRISYNEAGKPNRRIPKQGLLGRGFSSLRTLPRMISRPDLGKIRGFFRKKRPVGEVYPVPPDAEKPSPPSKPEVFHEQDEYFLLRWDPPAYDGGLPIIGYIIQHLELGLPQVDQTVEKDDTQSWFSSEPGQVTSTEVLLNNLIPGTTYQFRVIAENLLGFSQPSDVSSPIVFNPRGELDDWFCPPVIIVPLDESYTVIEHERLVLAIEITGQPYPIVKWYGNDGVELGKVLDPVKYSVVSCGQRRVLTINAVDCGDSGVIRCVGENERGVVQCSCVVVVEAPPHIRRVLRSDLLKTESPYELNKTEEKMVRRQDKNDEELIFQAGELARFKFLYSGSPAPNVCVYHEADLVDGEEIPGSGRIFHERVNTEVTDNLITVKIANVKRSDRGEWTVRLDNVLGEDSASVLLTITDRPSEPGKPDVLQLSDNTVILKWDKPYDDGGCPVSGYIVEYFRSEWGVWLKACTTKNPYTKIRDLIPGSKYMFRVKAENLYGMSDPSSESVELLITDLASTLRSVTGDGEGALLMTTVVEEEEEAVKIEEEEPGKRKQGSSTSLNRVSAGTMTDLSAIGVVKSSTGVGVQRDEEGKVGDEEPAPSGPSRRFESEPKPSSPQPPRKTLRLEPQSEARSPSPSRLLKVTLQPQVVVLPEDEDIAEEEEDILLEPHRSPSPHVIQAPATPQRSLSPSRHIIAAPATPQRSPSPSRHIIAAPQRSPSPSPSPIAPPRSRTIIQQTSHIDEEAIALTKSQEFSIYSIPSKKTESLFASPPVPPPRHQLSSSPAAVPVEQTAEPTSAQAQPTPSPKFTIPVIRPIEQPKKLYSRSEIIKSAATDDLDHYYLSLTTEDTSEGTEEEHVEEPEEDPELLKVKEALSKDDHLFDDLEDEEDLEYEYDFDKLQEEYENDRRKGQVSRQDSGVSARSAEQSGISRGESFNEDEEDGRPRSVMSDVLPKKPVLRMGSFERAQSEVVSREKPVFEFSSTKVKVEELHDEELVPPPVEPRRTISPSPQRTFGPDNRRTLGGSQSQSGSRTMLHDRFTDYIAMKASSRNKRVGSSLRSLSSSRYSSTENVQSRDSGRSSMAQQQEHGEATKSLFKQFSWREFDAQEECRAVKKLERSVSVGSKGLSVFRISQQRILDSNEVVGVNREIPVTHDMTTEGRGRSEEAEMADHVNREFNRGLECAFISTPEIYSSERGVERGFSVLEHSRSESHMGREEVPDSGLKERVLGAHHVPGGVDYETEEESCSAIDAGFSAISEEGEVVSGSGADGGPVSGAHLDRDLPRDRENTRGRLRKRVSFGSSDVEEISWDEDRRRGFEFRRGDDEEEVEGQDEDETNQGKDYREGEEEEERVEGQYEHVEEAQDEYADERQEENVGEGDDKYVHEGQEECAGDEQDEYADERQEENLDEGDDKYVHEGQEECAGDEQDEYAEEEQEEFAEEGQEKHPVGEEEFSEEHEGYEVYERDETHADDEFDDDGEVFEMDIEGIDPRIYAEEEIEVGPRDYAEEDAEIEGEDDSGSGVMYVLLEPEGIKVRDLSEFEESFVSERDERLESLLSKVDQFLESDNLEEKEKEDVYEKTGDGLVEGESGEPFQQTETASVLEEIDTEAEVKEEQAVAVDARESLLQENVNQEQEELLVQKMQSVPEPEESSKENETCIDLVPTQQELTDTYVVDETRSDQDKITKDYDEANVQDDHVSSHELDETATNDIPVSEKPELENLLETDLEVNVDKSRQEENIPIETENDQRKRILEISEEQNTNENVHSDTQEVKEEEKEVVSTLTTKESGMKDQEHIIQSEAVHLTESEQIEEQTADTQTVSLPCDKPSLQETLPHQDIPEGKDRPTEAQQLCDIPATRSLSTTQPQTKLHQDQIPPPKLDNQQNLHREKELPPQPPILDHHPNSSSERLEPPPPPPRPTTFSYKTYMTEHQRPTHRSHSREPPRTSMSQLATVKEEPPLPQKPPPSSNARPQSPELSYKPNMSVYFERLPRTSRSLRSHSSSLASSTQELPQIPCLPRPFRSPTEESDPPVVSIEEIRARIEQNRLELLRPLITKPQEEEEPSKEIVPERKQEEDEVFVDAPISPFMNYLFNAAFYLMLSPMLVFVDSLYFGLLSLLLVACVHFFIIRQ